MALPKLKLIKREDNKCHFSYMVQAFPYLQNDGLKLVFIARLTSILFDSRIQFQSKLSKCILKNVDNKAVLYKLITVVREKTHARSWKLIGVGHVYQWQYYTGKICSHAFHMNLT